LGVGVSGTVVGVTSRSRTPALWRVGIAAAAGVALMCASGCDGDSQADPGDGSSSTSAAPSPTGSTGSGTASPSVRPATGPKLSPQGASVRAPAGFRKEPDLASFQKSASDPESFTQVTISVVATAAEPGPDELAEIARNSAFKGNGQVLDTVELGGVDFYHVSGAGRGGLHLEEYGAAHEQMLVKLVFEFDNDLTPSARGDLMGPVLASFAWT